MPPEAEANKPAAVAAPVPDAPAPAPVHPDDELKVQIAKAKAAGARAEKEAAEKGKGKKKPEPKAKAAPKSEEPDGKTDPAPPPAEEDEPEAPADLATPSAGMIVRARELAEKGDLDGAIELVFGKKADAFRLNSARWKEWRTSTQKAQRAVADREQQVSQIAQRLQREYSPFVEARKLFEADDYEGAFQKAFGVDLDSFQKKALHKRIHGKNPEVEQLRRELRERDERDAKLQREQEQRQLQAQQQKQHAANVNAITSHLGSSADPDIAELGKRPRFVQRVYRDFLQEVKRGADAGLLTVTAIAERVRDEIVEEFGPVFGSRDRSASGGPHQGGTNPESPHGAGKKPARQGDAKAPPTNLSQRGAQEASAPGRPLSDEELYRKYTRIAESKVANG